MRRRGSSGLEEEFLLHIRASKVDQPTREYRFDEKRKWRFDFAWPDRRLAVEIDGVLWNSMGRHQHPKGIDGDNEKLNQAVLQGWKVLRFSGRQVKSGYAISTLEEAMRSE